MEITLSLTTDQVCELQTAIELRKTELVERKLTKGYKDEDIRYFVDMLKDVRRQINEQRTD